VVKESLKVVSKSIHINSAMEENSIWNSGRMLNDRLIMVQKRKCISVLTEDKFNDIGAEMETSLRKHLFWLTLQSWSQNPQLMWQQASNATPVTLV